MSGARGDPGTSGSRRPAPAPLVIGAALHQRLAEPVGGVGRLRIVGIERDELLELVLGKGVVAAHDRVVAGLVLRRRHRHSRSAPPSSVRSSGRLPSSVPPLSVPSVACPSCRPADRRTRRAVHRLAVDRRRDRRAAQRIGQRRRSIGAGSCGSAAAGVAPSVGAAACGFPAAPPSSCWKRNSLSSVMRSISVCIWVSWNCSPSTWPVSSRICSSSSWMRTRELRRLLALRHGPAGSIAAGEHRGKCQQGRGRAPSRQGRRHQRGDLPSASGASRRSSE